MARAQPQTANAKFAVKMSAKLPMHARGIVTRMGRDAPQLKARTGAGEARAR